MNTLKFTTRKQQTNSEDCYFEFGRGTEKKTAFRFFHFDSLSFDLKLDRYRYGLIVVFMTPLWLNI